MADPYVKSILVLIFCAAAVLYVLKRIKARFSAGKMHVNIIMALCTSYQNVYVVNINSGKVFIYKLTERIRSRYGERFASGSYDENFRIYEENEVLEADRPLFDKVNEISKIRGILKNQDEYSFVYRVKGKNPGEKVHFYQCYFIKPKSGREFVVTFKNVDDLMEAKEKINSLMENQTIHLKIMSSIAGIYLVLYFIDLKKDTIVEFNTTREMKKYVFGNDRAGEQIRNAMAALCCADFAAAGIEFTDLSTLRDRLRDKKYISAELSTVSAGWIRLSFIAVDSDEGGYPKEVLFAIQEINNEKRREEVLISNANTDGLTKLLNRHAYEEEIREIERLEKEGNLGDDFACISFDLNGLKNANDKFGHAAGDELLLIAASCIKNAFGSYGKIFRIGGDEFQAIVFAGAEQLEGAEREFEEECRKWNGKAGRDFSISYGIVTKKENPDSSIDSIISLADKLMYRKKSEYYLSKGVDLRGTCGAMEILFQSYTKILKVNLDDGSFSVIKIEEDEENSVRMSGGTASRWISEFGNSDFIDKASRREFLRKTDFEYLKNCFEKDGKIVSLCYERKIHGKFRKVQLEILRSREYAPENRTAYFFVRKLEDGR